VALTIDFMGLGAMQGCLPTDRNAPVVRRRTYLDSAATCLMPRAVWGTVGRYLESVCANPHTHAHLPGRETTAAIDRAHQLVGQLVGKRPDDLVIFCGSGATEPLNLLASAMFAPDRAWRGRDTVLVSTLEHHSNMLPWMRAAPRIAYIDSNADGSFCMDGLLRLVQKCDGRRVRAITVTALSNVTGAIPPLSAIADVAHQIGAELVVDAAQAAAHIPLDMTGTNIDYLALSGHKLYAPGSPGALIGRPGLFRDCGWTVGQVGGGTVERVELENVWFVQDPARRQEAGTPNVPGCVAIGAAAKLLQTIGLEQIRQHEQELVAYGLARLLTVPNLAIYGPADASQRGGVLTFNLLTLPHGLVAAALNDYFAIAVRNGCFCAQPYARAQSKAMCEQAGFCPLPGTKRGMVRASLALFTTQDDIDLLVQALVWIGQNAERLTREYVAGDAKKTWFHHASFVSSPPFSLDQAIGVELGTG
jgi:cysteine desulfurase/selenocysteine lyase